MYKIRFVLFTLLVSLSLMIALLLQAWAGSGITTDKGNGRVLDLTVFFDDQGQNRNNWILYNFTESHNMLYKASRGLLRFGRIRIGMDKSARGRADIRIDKDGHASVSQRDSRVNTSLGTEDTLWLFEEDLYAPIVTLHELGHYVFTLSDEYKSDIFKTQNGKVVMIEKGNEHLSFCSTKDSDNKAHSCLMYDNSSPKSVYLFCGPEHLKRNDFSDGSWAVSRQERDHNKSCGDTIASFFKVATLPDVPANNPPDSPTFITLKPEVRLSVFIQANLSDADMTKAKKMAADAVRSLRLPGTGRDGDSVGISTFTGSVQDLYGWVDIKTQSDVDDAVKAINDIKATTGTVDLEASLRSEITSIVGSDYPFSKKSILLFTNGPGKVSQALIDDMRRNDIVVDVVSLTDNANTQSLKALTGQTAGDFISRAGAAKSGISTLLFPDYNHPSPFLTGRADITGTEEADSEVANTTLGGYAIASFSGTLTPGTPQSQSLPVDTLNDEITISFSSTGGPLTLVVKDPGGTVINLETPPSGVRVQKTDTQVLLSIEKPTAGTWTAQVDGASAAAYVVELSGTGEEMGDSELTGQTVSFPGATLLAITVEKGQVVTGCQVQAVVTHPNGITVTVPLFDDGNEAYHGDEKANDGSYSNFFTQYSGSGTYKVEFRLNNQNGQYSDASNGADLLPGDPAPGPTGPAPVFQRSIFDSFVMSDVPSGGGAALLAPGNLTIESSAPGQATLNWTDTNGGGTVTVIQRSLGDPSKYQEMGTVSSGLTQYTDLATGMDGQVYYRLVARGTSGDSLPGSAVSIDAEKVALALGSTDTGYATGLLRDNAGSTGSCFVATAAYGSYLDPHVKVLRTFRDRHLLTNKMGKLFVKTYYAVSPQLAKSIAPSPFLRAAARHMLSVLIFSIEYPWAAVIVLCLGTGLGVAGHRRLKRKQLTLKGC